MSSRTVATAAGRRSFVALADQDELSLRRPSCCFDVVQRPQGTALSAPPASGRPALPEAVTFQPRQQADHVVSPPLGHAHTVARPCRLKDHVESTNRSNIRAAEPERQGLARCLCRPAQARCTSRHLPAFPRSDVDHASRHSLRHLVHDLPGDIVLRSSMPPREPGYS